VAVERAAIIPISIPFPFPFPFPITNSRHGRLLRGVSEMGAGVRKRRGFHTAVWSEREGDSKDGWKQQKMMH